MLKRVNVSDVELGMFIHKLEGNWFRHPFWRSRFLLEDPVMLNDLHESRVDSVLIDTDKGLDVRTLPIRRIINAAPPGEPPHPIILREKSQRRIARPAALVNLRATGPHALAREFGVARNVANNSRKVISRVFLESRFGKTLKSGQVTPVIEDIFASIQRNPHAFNGLMRCKRDNEHLYRHALAVSALMVSLARQMKLSPVEVREAGMAGLLIDVGIGHLPVDLARHDGDYRNLPHDVLCQHVQLGRHILESAGGFPDPVLSACLNHHERLDGSGYPAGLKGEQIDRITRMAAVCDSYDTLASGTASDQGMNPAVVLQAMNSQPGWFDPKIMEAFTTTMGVYPVGSVVRLRSERLAMVFDQDEVDPLRPRVRAFYSIRENRFVNPEDIALAECFGQDELIGIADPEGYGIADFPRLRERLFNGAAQAG